jgi:protein arginine kinase activator
MHGNTTHCGKNSGKAAEKPEKPAEETKEETIKKLQSELDAAVKEQNFERAAELRDKIKEMEG